MVYKQLPFCGQIMKEIIYNTGEPGNKGRIKHYLRMETRLSFMREKRINYHTVIIYHIQTQGPAEKPDGFD
jgi:hypothetical protein